VTNGSDSGLKFFKIILFQHGATSEMKLGGCIVWNAHNTVLGSNQLVICATV